MKRGWRVTEQPTVWLPRASGTTKKGKNWLFGFRYGRVVLETWWKVRGQGATQLLPRPRPGSAPTTSAAPAQPVPAAAGLWGASRRIAADDASSR